MSPSGCYIKAQLRDTRLEQSCAPNVMTFFLKSTTQPFNSVTRCTTLTQVLVSFRENVQMWVWFSQEGPQLGFF